MKERSKKNPLKKQIWEEVHKNVWHHRCVGNKLARVTSPRTGMLSRQNWNPSFLYFYFILSKGTFCRVESGCHTRITEILHLFLYHTSDWRTPLGFQLTGKRPQIEGAQSPGSFWISSLSCNKILYTLFVEWTNVETEAHGGWPDQGHPNIWLARDRCSCDVQIMCAWYSLVSNE